MDPELFRHLIPGLIFWLPTLALVTLGFETPKDEGQTWATVVFAATPPVGWLMYQNFRALWLGWPGYGYENAPFIQVLRQNLRFRWDPAKKYVLVDFGRVAERLGVRRFEFDQFLRCFHWRSFAKSTRSNRRRNRASFRKGETVSNESLSLEPLADLLLFDDSSFDYARTISTVRYAYMTAAFALANGLIFSASLWCVLGTARRGGAVSVTEAVREVIRLGFQKGFSEGERAGLGMLAIWVVLSLALATYRFRLATAEYFGRTTLITVMKSDLGVVKHSDLESKLAPELQQALMHLGDDGVAAFDLDGTLIEGDIGEAVFARLLLDHAFGPRPAFNYTEYEKLKVHDEEQAYRRVVTAMAGFTEARIRETTERLLRSSGDSFAVEGFQIPIPRPKLAFQQLLQLLWARRYRCLILTASNQWSAEIVAWNFFGINRADVFGVRTLVTSAFWRRDVRLTDQIVEPVTIGAGKAILLNSLLGGAMLDLAAGNSHADGSMLALVKPAGVVVWAGDVRKGKLTALSHLQPGVHSFYLDPTARTT
jgi:phosphoserine phosphatase